MTDKSDKGTSAVEAANNLAKCLVNANTDSSLIPKVPVQQRGKERFNAIIEAAEALVLEGEAVSISAKKVAQKANIPTASVYQYFPSMAALFAVMAEKHYTGSFNIVGDLLDETEILSWRDLANTIVEGAFLFYTQDKICEYLFLGSSHSPGVDDFANSRLSRVALWFMEFFCLRYKRSDLEALPEKLVLCLQVTETIFNRSLNLHGEIQNSYKEEAQIMVVNYLGEFFSRLEE